MSHLNKIVRRVLLEAAPVADEPQASAQGTQPRVRAAAKRVKGENAVSPDSHVDPSAYVEGTSVGYQDPAADVLQGQKFTVSQIANSLANGVFAGDPRYPQRKPEASEFDEAEREARQYKSGDGLKSQVLGDSAVSNSQVFAGSTVWNSAVSESAVGNAAISGGSVTKSRIINAKLTDCTTLNDSLVGSTVDRVDDTRGPRHLTAISSKFDNASAIATVPATITTSHLEKSKIRLSRAGSRIDKSTIVNSRVILSGGARDSIIKYADIADASIGYALAGTDDESAHCDVVIKGTSGSLVFIRDAVITDSATIVATKGEAPQITGYPQQKAIIEGHAKVYDSAHVAGRVSGNAEVFGNAKVEGNATITGTCRVGGTARMTKGTYSSGEYMEGTFTGGDEAYSLASRAKRAVTSAGDAISAGVKGLLDGED